MKSISETNRSFDSCNSRKRLGPSRLHGLHASKPPFVSLSEFSILNFPFVLVQQDGVTLLGLGLLVGDMADVDGVGRYRVGRLLLLVQVRAGDGQHTAVRREGQRGDGRRVAVQLTQPLLVQPVPDVDVAVRAAGGERVVLAVEADGVHRVDVLHAGLLDAVALEGVLLLLHLRARVEVLYGHAALDRAEHVAELVGETADAARLVLERRLLLLQRLRHVAQVPDVHLPPRSAHHQPVAARAERVHAVGLGVHARAARLARVPQLDVVVPSAGDDDAGLCGVLDAADWRAVLPHHRLRAAVEVEHLAGVGGGGGVSEKWDGA